MVNKNNDKVLVSVKNVVKRYEKNNIILNDVSFDIKEGECLGLAGESGCGKSTLSKCILGLEKIDSGEIIFAGDKIQNRRSLRPKKGKRIIQAVFQNPTSALNPRMKIIDSLMEPLDNQPWIKPSFLKDVRGDRRKVAEKLMSMVKLKKEYLEVYMDERTFAEALKGAKIPILVLDQKWHRLFAINGKPEEVKTLETELNELLARQGKLNTDLKEYKKVKAIDNLSFEVHEGEILGLLRTKWKWKIYYN